MLQANEVLKMVLEIGEILSGKLLVYNMLNNEQQKFEFCKIVTNTIDLKAFKNKYTSGKSSIFEILSAEALEQINNPQVVFLDVRNWDEIPKIDIANSIQIPLHNLEDELWKLNVGTTIFVFCQSGIRSKKAVEILIKHNFKNTKSIIGGVKSLEKYPHAVLDTF